MPAPVSAPDSDTIRLWSDDPGAGFGPLHGDAHAARARVAAAAGDSAAMLPLRRVAPALADGTDWSRVDDHALLDQIGSALAQGRLWIGATQQLQLRRLVSSAPPVAAPPPPPAASSAPRAAPAAPAPAPAAPRFDAAAMVAALVQAAEDGVPFCEECLAAAAASAAEEAAPPVPAVPPPLPPAEALALPALLGWVEVQLLDEAGEPVAGERWQIVCSDASVHEGTTDARGCVRLDGIPPGVCSLTWPDRDMAAVVAA